MMITIKRKIINCNPRISMMSVVRLLVQRTYFGHIQGNKHKVISISRRDYSPRDLSLVPMT